MENSRLSCYLFLFFTALFSECQSERELDKDASLSICGLASAQSQMDLLLDTLYARKQTKGRHLNQSGEAMSRVTASAMFFQGPDD